MPKLFIPICIQTNFTNHHKITHYQQIKSTKTLITGGINGEIIIWKPIQDKDIENIIYQPQSISTSSLSQTVGNITCLQLINEPIYNIFKNMPIALLSIHQDNRIRIWDLEDGRCINISPHNTFKSIQNVQICLPINVFNKNRFFVCGGNGKNIEIIDIWQNKSIFVCPLDEGSKSVVNIQIQQEKKLAFVADNKNILYIFNLGDFYDENLNDYNKYIENQIEYKQKLKNCKCNLLKKTQITFLKQKLENFKIINDQHTVFFYKKTIIFQNTQEFYKLINQQQISHQKAPSQTQKPANDLAAKTANFLQQTATLIKPQQQQKTTLQQLNENIYIDLLEEDDEEANNPTEDERKIDKFINVEYLQNQQLFILQTKFGKVNFLSSQDIEKLHNLNQRMFEKDLSFSYASFSYYKDPKSLQANMTIKMLEVINKMSQIDEEYYDLNINYNLLHFEIEEDFHIYNFDSINQVLQFSSFKNLLQSNTHQIKQILFEDEKVQDIEDSKNTISYCEIKIVFYPDHLQNIIYKKIESANTIKPYYEHKLNKANKSLFTLNYSIENLFTQQFYEQYGQALYERFPDEIVSVSSLNFIENKDLYMFYGTESGKVIGFPILFNERSNNLFDILYFEFDPTKRITFLDYKNDLLIISSESSRTAILKLTLKDITKIQSNFKDKLNIIDISNLLVFKELFSAPIKHLMKPKACFSVINSQQNQQQQVVQDSINYFNDTICLILANNSVLVYNQQSQCIDYYLTANQGSIYGIYYHPVQDYIIIVTNEGLLHFWSIGTQRFERTGEFKKYIEIFDLKGLLERCRNSQQDMIHKMSAFKQINGISQLFNILEYNLRYYDTLVNYYEESSKSTKTNTHIYEQLGDQLQIDGTIHQQLSLLWIIQEQKYLAFQSKLKPGGASILKLKLNKIKQVNTNNQNFILFIDCKKHNQTIVNLQESKQNYNIFPYVPFVFPWYTDPNLDTQLNTICEGKKSVLKYTIGNAGMAETFSFSLLPNSQYSTSQYQSTIQALSIMLNFIHLGSFYDSKQTYNLMLETASLLTKQKLKINKNFKSLSLPTLARYCIDETNEMMSSAINLMITSILNKDQDIKTLYFTYSKLQDINFKQNDSLNISLQKISDQSPANDAQKNIKTKEFTIIEITWLLILIYINIFSEKQIDSIENFIHRIDSGIQLNTCLTNPDLVAPCLKILTEGSDLWKSHIRNYKLLISNLMYIYFHFNTQQESLELIKGIPINQTKQSIQTLEQFLKQPEATRKRLKILTIKTIISLSEICQSEFLPIIKKQIQGFNVHLLYPCSVIDIIRNYLKVQGKNAIKQLPIFIEAILKTLDPQNPQYRKICHDSATNALHTIFKIFSNVSFHQQSQQFAICSIGSQQCQIFIYDLREAVKWRVLNGSDCYIDALSFDNQGKHIAAFSLQDSALRIWKVGPTGFFGAILNMSGKHIKEYIIEPKEYQKHLQGGGEQKIQIQWHREDKKLQIKFGNNFIIQREIFS